MVYKGKMSWIPSDVMTHLYVERDPTMPVADALRDRLGLAIPEPELVAEKVSEPYPVMHLDVGEEISFEGMHKSTDVLVKAIKKQAKKSGRVFTVNVTNTGCQVIRTK